jgi:hypothetical protein
MTAQPWEARLAHLEGTNAQIADRLNSIDGRFAQIDVRFGEIENRIQQQFLWVIGSIFGTWITTILAILFHH